MNGASNTGQPVKLVEMGAGRGTEQGFGRCLPPRAPLRNISKYSRDRSTVLPDRVTHLVLSWSLFRQLSRQKTVEGVSLENKADSSNISPFLDGCFSSFM